MHIDEDIIRRVLRRLAAEMEPVARKRLVEVVNGGAGASYDGLQAKQIPVKFAVGDTILELPEHMADNEEIPEGVRRRYNKMLAQLGQTDMLMPEWGMYKLVRAHEWIWLQAGEPKAIEPKIRKKAEPRPETLRDYVWKGEPCTKAQFIQRVRMTKDVIPTNCLMPVNPDLPADVLYRFEPPADTAYVAQAVQPEVKAKVSNADLEKAMAVLGLDPKILAALNV